MIYEVKEALPLLLLGLRWSIGKLVNVPLEFISL